MEKLLKTLPKHTQELLKWYTQTPYVWRDLIKEAVNPEILKAEIKEVPSEKGVDKPFYKLPLHKNSLKFYEAVEESVIQFILGENPKTKDVVKGFMCILLVTFRETGKDKEWQRIIEAKKR